MAWLRMLNSTNLLDFVWNLTMSCIYVTPEPTVSRSRVFTTLHETAAFLDAVGKIYKAFSVHEKHAKYELCNLRDAVTLLKETLQYLLRKEALIRGEIQSLPRSLHGPQENVAEKTLMEFHLEQCLNVRIDCPHHIVGCTFEQADQEGMLIQQQQKEIEELKNHVTLLSNEVHHPKHQLRKTKEAPMRLGMALQMIKLRKQAGRFCDGIYTWRIEKFRDCFQDAISGSCTAKYSPSFYTSLYLGYNPCMRINMNGMDDGVGKHMAFFIHLMLDDHDDFLDWPIAKKFRLSIVDRSEDEEVHCDISKTLVAEPKWQACQRPVAPHNINGWGYPKLAPIKLICQPQYTKNDTLLMKFEIIGKSSTIMTCLESLKHFGGCGKIIDELCCQNVSHYHRQQSDRPEEPPVGLLAQLVKYCIGITEVMGSTPVQA
ncbi:TNF receptor-associated factor 6-A [Stylophora pistillata]|uniref:TNF receptor-associated factor 6-A n=1 Tax=Stylophora pistillata TaxID=50429 RepID=A0A2B4RA63_STYPI|nr:TNF receptor-associated factor 6-A [Stylophora pistillata]